MRRIQFFPAVFCLILFVVCATTQQAVEQKATSSPTTLAVDPQVTDGEFGKRDAVFHSRRSQVGKLGGTVGAGWNLKDKDQQVPVF